VFSRSKAITPSDDQIVDFAPVLENIFSSYLESIGLEAGLLCIWKDEVSSAHVISTVGIPITPFNGAKKESLNLFIKDVLDKYPEPHIHSISDQLWKDIASLVDVKEWQARALFIPAYSGEFDFILICFADKKSKLENTEKEQSRAKEIIQIIEAIISIKDLNQKVKTIETYVKEIGHDIASSVQAIIAKFRNISRGLITGPAVIVKIQEAEDEIMATYRTAETLGITVDPDYNISCGENFFPNDAVDEVIKLCKSEADERHIEIRTEYLKSRSQLWGDMKAIQSALMQLLINAIKYARGSTFITIRVSETSDKIEFSVTDQGMEISEDDKIHIWEFGWRGSRAKEMHVNGSGIGLYTVNKIIKAHNGSVGCKTMAANRGVVTFLFRIPKRDILKKSNLL
jgi:hypothetical protein